MYRKIPNPSPAAGPGRGPRPLPRRAAGAPMPASQQSPDPQSQPGHPTAPHHRHLPRTERQGSAEGAASICRGHSREALESAAGICRAVRQGNAGRRNKVEFPEKFRTYPLQWAPPAPLPSCLRFPVRKPTTPRPPKPPRNPPPPALPPPSPD